MSLPLKHKERNFSKSMTGALKQVVWNTSRLIQKKYTETLTCATFLLHTNVENTSCSFVNVMKYHKTFSQTSSESPLYMALPQRSLKSGN